MPPLRTQAPGPTSSLNVSGSHASWMLTMTSRGSFLPITPLDVLLVADPSSAVGANGLRDGESDGLSLQARKHAKPMNVKTARVNMGLLSFGRAGSQAA